MNWSASRPETRRYALLFLLTYAFMLRLPSEALPLALGGTDRQAVLSREGEQLVLRLRRRLLVCVLAVGASLPRFRVPRKNRPHGSRLVRGCWCSESRARVASVRAMRLDMGLPWRTGNLSIARFGPLACGESRGASAFQRRDCGGCPKNLARDVGCHGGSGGCSV